MRRTHRPVLRGNPGAESAPCRPGATASKSVDFVEAIQERQRDRSCRKGGPSRTDLAGGRASTPGSVAMIGPAHNPPGRRRVGIGNFTSGRRTRSHDRRTRQRGSPVTPDIPRASPASVPRTGKKSPLRVSSRLATESAEAIAAETTSSRSIAGAKPERLAVSRWALGAEGVARSGSATFPW